MFFVRDGRIVWNWKFEIFFLEPPGPSPNRNLTSQNEAKNPQELLFCVYSSGIIYQYLLYSFIYNLCCDNLFWLLFIPPPKHQATAIQLQMKTGVCSAVDLSDTLDGSEIRRSTWEINIEPCTWNSRTRFCLGTGDPKISAPFLHSINIES